MNIKQKIKGFVQKQKGRAVLNRKLKQYKIKYRKYSFPENGVHMNCEEHYEASITKLYHTIEKGLSYTNYRAGFGRSNVDRLINQCNEYAVVYGTDAFFYKTALSVLKEYIVKNKANGFEDAELEKRIVSLPGEANISGGALLFESRTSEELHQLDYHDFILDRHSIRHFSKEPVDVEKLKKAIYLAQHTPSACNRQGWKARIIESESVIRTILENQNGNRGFGDEINKLVIISADLRYFTGGRELFQPYVDGGMYAMSVINGLHYYGVATIPLSGALNDSQELNVRSVLPLEDSETIIIMIGVGNYPEECITTKSARKPIDIPVV